jgi:hypothetical protein
LQFRGDVPRAFGVPFFFPSNSSVTRRPLLLRR